MTATPTPQDKLDALLNDPREPRIPMELECAMEVVRAKVPLAYLETMQDYMNHIRADDTARIEHMEGALRLIVEKSDGAVKFFQDSGEMLFLQYAHGCLVTARAALDGTPLPFPPPPKG